jgi:hypothetical protein
VSPRIFPAGVHRLPEHASIGLAVSLTAFREADSLYAGLHSSPNSANTGLALMIGSREADPMSVQPAARLVAGTIGWTPRGGATRIRAVSPWRRRAPIPGCCVLKVRSVPPSGALGGRVVERVGSDATVFFIRNEAA